MKKISIALLLSTLLATPALADNTGKLYVAGQLGSSSLTNANITINGVPNTFANPGAVGIAAGYHFNQNLAIELGYTRLGTTTLTSTSGDVILDMNSLNLAAVGTYSMNSEFDLFAKLGISNNKFTESVTGTLIFTDGTKSTTGSQSDALLGLGAQYHATTQLSFRAQYENFGKFSSGTTPLSASVVSLGLLYDF